MLPDTSATTPCQGETAFSDYVPVEDLDQLIIPAIIAKGREAFLRDLPQLLPNRFRQWVGYHGDKCLGFADCKSELYEACLAQGVPESELLIECVFPVPGEIEQSEYMGR